MIALRSMMVWIVTLLRRRRSIHPRAKPKAPKVTFSSLAYTGEAAEQVQEREEIRETDHPVFVGPKNPVISIATRLTVRDRFQYDGKLCG